MPYRIPLHRPNPPAISRHYLAEALAGQQSADGPYGRLCEARLTAQLHRPVLMTSSCSAAFELIAELSGLGQNDEFILPSFTFPSTASALARRGAVPVFVDIRADTLNLDERLVEAAITSRTRALIPVHYAGVGCDMEALQRLCRRHNLLLIEDAAQGLDAYWHGQPLGSFGDFAAISFHSTKNIGCGEGGALLLNASHLKERACELRDKGTNRQAFLRGDVSHYQWVATGWACGLSDINAALLLGQLEQSEPLTQARLVRWQHYQTQLEGAERKGLLQRPHPPATAAHNGHIYYVLLDSRALRDEVEQRLKRAGIQACSHYEPLHTSPFGQQIGISSGSLEVTTDLSGRLLRLPLWNDMSESEQTEVIERMLACITD